MLYEVDKQVFYFDGRACNRITLVIAIVFAALLCLNVFTADAAGEGPVPAKFQRSHEVKWYDTDGTLLLTKRYDYVGKEPVGKVSRKVDWKKRNVDFYNVTATNHSDKKITWVKLETWPHFATGDMDREVEGKVEKVPSRNTMYLRGKWKKTVMKPGETWTQNNTYYWSEGRDWNVRYMDWTLNIDGKNRVFNDYILFIR
jgi:hypothetical protein